MNTPKLKYENDNAVFYIHYKGVYVELLKVKLINADFKAIKHYHNLAKIELNEFSVAIKHATKQAA